ncbi:DUF3137 domain-containing protein [Emcibacter nanhaiensis]|uniref:DUF3137 domain-containing protein n=1 Tax=Emcibacter nanhaiensis TaxID=1505037 RepID=A0A501PMU3_9PROT|nr:DUF3137 domain-containing protein [Emcibacter nanhaiensis]TPD61820.1 DUF3137 domain-containing protein [Emcibacter nanhaiensis]
MQADSLLEGFESYFETELLPELQEIEAGRPRAMKIFMAAVVAAVLVFCAAAYFILSRRMADPQVMIFVGVGCVGIGALGLRPLSNLQKQAKNRIMTALCGHLGLHYQMKPAHQPVSTFKNLRLVPGHNKRKIEDRVYGQVKGADFNMFEAKLIQESRDSKGRKSSRTVFRGLLSHFDFHKQFSGTTIIRKDRTAIGNFFDGAFASGERVKLEDPEFERLFEVYATDQVEARYLLTPTFMERIKQLAALVGTENLQLAFDRGNLYLSIRKPGDSFEGGSMFSSFADPGRVYSSARELALIYDIAEVLRLELATRV